MRAPEFLKGKFFRNSIIYTTGTFIGGVFNYLFHFAVSRQLSVAEYGELQGLLALFPLVGFAASSISYFVIKQTSAFANDKNYQATRAFVSWLSGALFRYVGIMSVIFLLLAPLIANVLQFNDLWGILFVGGGAFFNVIVVVYAGALSGWEDFFKVSAASMIGSASKLILGISIALFFPRASVIAASFLASAFLTLVITRYWSNRTFSRDADTPSKIWEEYFSKEELRATVVPIVIFSSLVIALGDIDVLFVKIFTSPEMTGHFGALKTIGKIILTVNLAIISVFLPRACAEGHNGNGSSRKAIWNAYGLIGAVSIISILIYTLFPELIISILFGEKYLVFAGMLWLYAVMAVALSLLLLEANFAYARHDFSVSYALGGTIFLVFLSVIFLRQDFFHMTTGITGALTLGYFAVLTFNIKKGKTGGTPNIIRTS